jgi:hypothetical protein
MVYELGALQQRQRSVKPWPNEHLSFSVTIMCALNFAYAVFIQAKCNKRFSAEASSHGSVKKTAKEKVGDPIATRTQNLQDVPMLLESDALPLRHRAR